MYQYSRTRVFKMPKKVSQALLSHSL